MGRYHAQKLPPLIVLPFLVLGLMGATKAQAESDFKVTLLGTGSPTPDPARSGPSTLVQAGNQTLLFDAGRGVPVRLKQINVPLGKIDALFLTHYHSDHTAGIPDVRLSGWLPASWGSRKVPFRVVGPVGAKSLMANLEKAYALDIKIRLEDQKLPPEGVATTVAEFEQDGVVYEKDGVTVIAFTVDHGPAIKPAVGYRIEYKGRSVGISGDTRYDQNVIKYGTGKQRLAPISKQGDRYLRRILVVGAFAVLRQARAHPEKYPWVAQLLARKPTKVVAVALANKTARIAWAVLTRKDVYRVRPIAA